MSFSFSFHFKKLKLINLQPFSNPKPLTWGVVLGFGSPGATSPAQPSPAQPALWGGVGWGSWAPPPQPSPAQLNCHPSLTEAYFARLKLYSANYHQGVIVIQQTTIRDSLSFSKLPPGTHCHSANDHQAQLKCHPLSHRSLLCKVEAGPQKCCGAEPQKCCKTTPRTSQDPKP